MPRSRPGMAATLTGRRRVDFAGARSERLLGGGRQFQKIVIVNDLGEISDLYVIVGCLFPPPARIGNHRFARCRMDDEKSTFEDLVHGLRLVKSVVGDGHYDAWWKLVEAVAEIKALVTDLEFVLGLFPDEYD